MTNKRIEIRTIYDVEGNVYDIFDLQYLSPFDKWRGVHIYETIEDVIKWEKSILIIDARPEERKKEIRYKI